MLEKIKEKLERRFTVLPLHHIDTSVVIETEKTEDGRYCRKYFQLLGYKYMAKFSSITMGELFMTMLESKEPDARLSFLSILDH